MPLTYRGARLRHPGIAPVDRRAGEGQNGTMPSAQRLRLCMKDLWAQDVVEMIERETRKYEIRVITSPDDPDFAEAFQILWDCFGAHGEMEREEVVRSFLADDEYAPVQSGTFMKYFLIIARDREGRIRGVRDGTILLNPAYCADLCLVYLSHIYMLPDARGTVLSYWLRIAPVELAVQFMKELHRRGALVLPEPEKPGRYFGMRIDLAAEMEFWSPDDAISLQRILFYGRGGFDVIDPCYFPYTQPDFRPPEQIRATAPNPIPFMLLLRRIGREREAGIPLNEAEAVMRLLYDDFRCFCEPEHLASSLDVVLDDLRQSREDGFETLRLYPLPTSAQNIDRLRPIFRGSVYKNHYPLDLPEVVRYLEGPMKRRLAQKGYLREQLERIRGELRGRPNWVYVSRDRADYEEEG
jgi:hypothetical protein